MVDIMDGESDSSEGWIEVSSPTKSKKFAWEIHSRHLEKSEPSSDMIVRRESDSALTECTIENYTDSPVQLSLPVAIVQKQGDYNHTVISILGDDTQEEVPPPSTVQFIEATLARLKAFIMSARTSIWSRCSGFFCPVTLEKLVMIMCLLGAFYFIVAVMHSGLVFGMLTLSAMVILLGMYRGKLSRKGGYNAEGFSMNDNASQPQINSCVDLLVVTFARMCNAVHSPDCLGRCMEHMPAKSADWFFTSSSATSSAAAPSVAVVGRGGGGGSSTGSGGNGGGGGNSNRPNQWTASNMNSSHYIFPGFPFHGPPSASSMVVRSNAATASAAAAATAGGGVYYTSQNQ